MWGPTFPSTSSPGAFAWNCVTAASVSGPKNPSTETAVRLHAAAGVPAGTTGRDAAKKVPGRKRGLAVDVLGLVIAVVVLASSVHDNAFGTALLDNVAAGAGTVQKALVDQGFKKTVVDHGKQVGIDVEVVERNPAETGFVPQHKRLIVEQTNGILMLHRRLMRDHEHRPASVESRVYWAISDRMSKMLTGTSTPRLARSVTGGELTLGALLARLEEREREIAAQAEGAQERIAELTALLVGFDTAAEEIRIARKTLLELPDPPLPVPLAAKLPDHPAYQQIMAVFAAADAPLRARAVCEAMDLEIVPSNINNVRLKLKRLAEPGILAKTEQGLFTLPRP